MNLNPVILADIARHQSDPTRQFGTSALVNCDLSMLVL
jgi:hypothetical protein